MYALKVHRWGIEKLKDGLGVTRDSDLAEKLGMSLSTLKRFKRGDSVSGEFYAAVSVLGGKEYEDIFYTVDSGAKAA